MGGDGAARPTVPSTFSGDWTAGPSPPGLRDSIVSLSKRLDLIAPGVRCSGPRISHPRLSKPIADWVVQHVSALIVDIVKVPPNLIVPIALPEYAVYSKGPCNFGRCVALKGGDDATIAVFLSGHTFPKLEDEVQVIRHQAIGVQIVIAPVSVKA